MNTTTIILAQFWGGFMLIMALMMLIFPNVKERFLSMSEKPDLSLIFGFLSLILGIGSIVLHQEWDSTLAIVVSLFGWSSLLKGVLLISFPGFTKLYVDNIKEPFISIALVVIGLLGAWIMYLGCTC